MFAEGDDLRYHQLAQVLALVLLSFLLDNSFLYNTQIRSEGGFKRG
jgi:hypothetical protein